MFSFVPPAVPTPPGKPEISNVQRDRMTLTWSEPSHDGGKPIQGYIIERRENFSKQWNRVNRDLIKDTTFTIKGLTEGNNYEFRISAVNDTGIGNPSEVSAPPKLARSPAGRIKTHIDSSSTFYVLTYFKIIKCSIA